MEMGVKELGRRDNMVTIKFFSRVIWKPMAVEAS